MSHILSINISQQSFLETSFYHFLTVPSHPKRRFSALVVASRMLAPSWVEKDLEAAGL